MRKGEQFFLLFVRKRNNGVEIKSANGDNIVMCHNDDVNTAIGCTTDCTATLAVADAHVSNDATMYRDGEERITAESVTNLMMYSLMIFHVGYHLIVSSNIISNSNQVHNQRFVITIACHHKTWMSYVCT